MYIYIYIHAYMCVYVYIYIYIPFQVLIVATCPALVRTRAGEATDPTSEACKRGRIKKQTNNIFGSGGIKRPF